MLSFAGLEKSLENVVDFLYGMSASCAKAFSLIIRGSSLAGDSHHAYPLNYRKLTDSNTFGWKLQALRGRKKKFFWGRNDEASSSLKHGKSYGNSSLRITHTLIIGMLFYCPLSRSPPTPFCFTNQTLRLICCASFYIWCCDHLHMSHTLCPASVIEGLCYIFRPLDVFQFGVVLYSVASQ